MTDTITPAITNMPKSYLHDAEERAALLREGGMNLVYLAESQEAGEAGDEDAAWAWLAKATLPANVLMFFKIRRGADFIRKMGFPTRLADETYGPGWLDKPGWVDER